MKKKYSLLLIGSCVFSLLVSAQNNTSTPKTLLWRISGNGLSGNSYLYGTMHLQDKRVFNFSDSLYHYIEQADGFAMEVDMQEFTDSLVQKMIDQREDKTFDKKKLLHSVTTKKFVDSLLANVHKRNDKSSKRQLMFLRQQRMKDVTKHKEMPTIMDGFLYGIAKRQGKWVGGIEDVQDQLTVLDELGGEMTSEELSAPGERISIELEKMISIYLSHDLDKVEEYSASAYSDHMEDMLLFKRNIKMAERMDSLANIRTMFFAVGAAHLPGEKGVISELRKKGFRVEPVFSAVSIDPLQYVAKLSDLPWTKIEDDKKTYTVEMPGRASELNMYGDLFKMKLYVDISSLTCFMTGSLVVSRKMDISKRMDEIEKNTEGTFLSKKLIEREGDVKGIECRVIISGYYYKIQYLFKGEQMYMVMVGGENKETAESKDANKFFASFVANDNIPAEAPKQWSSFGLKDKAFSVMLPGTPKRNKKIEAQADNTDWKFTVYDYTDGATGVYCMIQVRDIGPGFHLTGDSSYFAMFHNNMGKVIAKTTRDSVFTINSFPAFSYEGLTADSSLVYKSLTVNRGNRVYMLLTGGAVSERAGEEMDRFLHSFTLTDYPLITWEKQVSPQEDFSAVVPASIELIEKKDEEGNITADDTGDLHYVSYNPANCISYEVFKKKISPYYWATSDSAFFEEMRVTYKKFDDSVLSKTPVTNGKLKGMEWLIKMPGNNNRKKIREILNGDTLFTLVSYIPSQYINDKEHEQFFSGFRVAAENTNSTILRSKAVILLTDLASADSTLFSRADEEVSNVPFKREDLPLLYQALLKSYWDDTLSNRFLDAKEKIVIAVSKLADSTTISFIRKSYPLQAGDKEINKLDLLNILCRYKTKESYSLLKELLLTQPPAVKGRKELNYTISDSLELSRSLYPEILPLVGNPLFTDRITSLTDDMLDSNWITREMVMPYQQILLFNADTALKSMQHQVSGEDYYGYEYRELLDIIAHFNDAKSNQLLQSYLLLDNLLIKQQVTLALLRNNQPVSAKEIEKIAADQSTRRGFYEELKKYGYVKSFPSKYLTQQYMAAADLYIYASDDEDPSEVKFLETRTVIYKGEQKRFYLFRITYGSDDGDSEKYEHLGVAGPYSMDKKKVDSDDNEITGLYYTENFDAKKLDKQFEAFLEKAQE